MIHKTTKLRWRRRLRRHQKQVENLSQQAGEQLDEHFFDRFPQLGGVARFVAGWIMLMVLLLMGVLLQTRALGSYYQQPEPTDGGIFTEGISGAFTTANPIYATGSVDSSVARLVFSGLMKYDQTGKLVGDLAERIEDKDNGKVYVVTLKPHAQWHDGRGVTAKDVVFTYDTIKNADAKSPLRPNWQGVKIEAQDDYTVVFTLPHPLASFPYSLTTGIVPDHLLSNIPASQLRTVAFNTVSPVGSGPFKWEALQVHGQSPDEREEQIGLTANATYHSGEPKIDRLIIRAVHNEDKLLGLFEGQQLDAVVGLDDAVSEITQGVTINEYSIPLNGQVMVFFKTSEKMLDNVEVRQALTQATNPGEIISGLGYPVLGSDAPLLKIHAGYDPRLTQLDENIAKAQKQLKDAGWKQGEDGIMEKRGQKLSFKLFANNTSEFAYIAQTLQRQWRRVGANVEVILQSNEDMQTTLAFHNYDVLLAGITLGSDPDVYAYWHSSQADLRSPNRLNFSEYKSSSADLALEAGRGRDDPNLRALKYKPFLSAWRSDAPAVSLFQPRFLYITRGIIYGFNPTQFNAPTDRYANVENWQVRTRKAPVQ